AEVEESTGLGDVSAISLGRLLPVRLRAGCPSRALVDSLLVADGLAVITAPYRVYTTPQMLADKLNVFKRLGERAVKRFLAAMSLESFAEEARRFSLETGMAPPELLHRLEEARARLRGVLGWYFKKGLLVLLVEREWANDVAVELARELKIKTRTHELAWSGVEME
ncbi:MAG: hypothetical protein QW405_03545, partial [Fervidicoccaceae archaeon]